MNTNQEREMALKWVPLGKTGIETSVAGLGGGGFSMLGKDKDPANAAAIVTEAYNLGVRFFDTAEGYRTEEIIGAGLKTFPRRKYTLSSKLTYRKEDGEIKSEEEIRRSLDASLRKLNTDYLDIYHVHGCLPEDYNHVRNQILPVLVQLKNEGKIRAVGITEAFTKDSEQKMMRKAVEDSGWDALLLGFNLLNQSASEIIIPRAKLSGKAVLVMFAVRKALRSKEEMETYLKKCFPTGNVMESQANELMGSLASMPVHLPDLAYQFCRDTDGIDLTLFGTGSIDHLIENIQSFTAPPLPPSMMKELKGFHMKGAGLTGQ